METTELTSEEIEKMFLPVTKDHDWYVRNCVGTDQIPQKAVNGRNGGTAFLTKDNKIMRTGNSTYARIFNNPNKMRYKPILDVLSDRSIMEFDKIFYDHMDNDAVIPADGYCLNIQSTVYIIQDDVIRNGRFDASRLSYGENKGDFDIKEVDFACVSGDRVVALVEEEGNDQEFFKYRDKIKEANYLIDRKNNAYSLEGSILFIVSKKYFESELDGGVFSKIVKCNHDEFRETFSKYIKNILGDG